MGNIELIIVMEIEAMCMRRFCALESARAACSLQWFWLSRALLLAVCCSILMVVIDLVAKLYQFGSELLRKKCVTFALPHVVN